MIGDSMGLFTIWLVRCATGRKRCGAGRTALCGRTRRRRIRSIGSV